MNVLVRLLMLARLVYVLIRPLAADPHRYKTSDWTCEEMYFQVKTSQTVRGYENIFTVQQLPSPETEQLLCKHAFISHKSLNLRRVESRNPLLVGLLIGLRVSKLGQIRGLSAGRSKRLVLTEPINLRNIRRFFLLVTEKRLAGF